MLQLKRIKLQDVWQDFRTAVMVSATLRHSDQPGTSSANHTRSWPVWPRLIQASGRAAPNLRASNAIGLLLRISCVWL